MGESEQGVDWYTERIVANCAAKMRFLTQAEARVISRKARHNGYTLFPYRCPVCSYWHLSSKKKLGKKKGPSAKRPDL